jgi:sec-independent protein translocase protein TatC
MAKKQDGEMSFLDHLEVLRWHLVRSAAAIVIFGILAFLFKDIIFNNIIIAPRNPDFWTNRMLCKLSQVLDVPALCINQHPFALVNISLGGQFTMHINISIVAGIILAFPYVFYEFYSFIAPALYQKERKYASIAIIVSSFLFMLGILFGYYLIVPLTVDFLGTYTVSAEVKNYINMSSYISTITGVALASGIVFELPVVVYFLTKIGVLSPSFMKKYRRHAYIVILIIAAIITPPDVFSQVMVTIPLVILYEASIFISKVIYRQREREMAG